jgi:cation diffusion facilitator CzcD-associated flavoprotein CzcO
MKSKSIKNPEIAEAIIPDWAIGCRRLTPGVPYIEALCEEKCQMVKETIQQFDETGIITKEGGHREYDVIILASGYDLSFKAYPMYGRNGVSLNDLYDEAPESYLGVCPPEMPSEYCRS